WSGSPNQNARTSRSPRPAFATSRICDPKSAVTACRAMAGSGERADTVGMRRWQSNGCLYCALAVSRKRRRKLAVMRKYLHIALNVIAIIICGALGGGVGFAIARAISLDGVVAALVAAVIGMVVATAAWAGGSSLLRALGWVK